MASRYIFSADARPGAGPYDWTGAASGGTITGSSGTVELVFDDTVFGSTWEGKQRLVAAIDSLKKKVEAAKVWPITSSS